MHDKESERCEDCGNVKPLKAKGKCGTCYNKSLPPKVGANCITHTHTHTPRVREECMGGCTALHRRWRGVLA